MTINLGVKPVLTLFAAIWFGAPACALDLPASAILTASKTDTNSISFPVSAVQNGTTQFDAVQGQITTRAYKIAGSSLTSFQAIEPLKAQLQADGFTIAFACADTVCGGYDFRYMLDLVSPPNMFVDLGDFQYVLAQHGDGRRVSIVTSRAGQSAFVQLTTVSPNADTDDQAPRASIPWSQINPSADLPLIEQLTTLGHAALEDLAFETGSARLGVGPFASLAAIAVYLRDRPDVRVVLVGHTDNVGGLSGNVALSKERAASVRMRLIDRHGVPAEQLGAQGVGYLAPRISNANKDGRSVNRRVEAILAPTQ
ncbi:OmpA family protein [Celeribacter marinus]|uniref:Outer membrane protein assembly factor YaeT n=1 Tax=Celeribacter marinus TaxID=1397108 RepID=A0A0P0AA10_9RHOB|nr:OmpA family protein [Celeribacter marinus]ALI55550.1 outer membrane protein assembly factor YaeT precursor [Celeribacter marinus]